jgi:hypothetical protein
MEVRDRLRRDAAQYLEAGEQIQAVFTARRPAARANDRAVVATDRRLLLFRLNFFGRVTGLAGEAARETKLGPCFAPRQHPLDVFGTRLYVHRLFFGDIAEADRHADEDRPRWAGDSVNRVSPDRGFYADPGGGVGVRYWDGLGWSPLVPAALAGDHQPGTFPARVLLPLPEANGRWQYAALRASRLTAWSAGLSGAAVLALVVGVLVYQAWLIFAVLLALMALFVWRQRQGFIKLDKAARKAPAAVVGQRAEDAAATRARRAGMVFAVWLVVTTGLVAGTVALYVRDLSQPHADFSWAVISLIASGFALMATSGAWRGLRRAHGAGQAAARPAQTGGSVARPDGDQTRIR